MSILQLIILYIAISIILFPVIVSILKYKRFTVHLKLIAWYIFLGSIIQVIMTILSLQKINNLWLTHIYAVEEFTVISLFFSYILNEVIDKRRIYILIGLFIIYAIINIIYFQPLNIYPSNTRTVGSIIIILYIFIAIYLRFKYDKHKQRINTWYFHLNKVSLSFVFIGIIVFYAGSILLFSITDQLANPKYLDKYLDINRVVWAGYRILVIVLYSFIGIGLLLFKPPKNNIADNDNCETGEKELEDEEE